LNGKAPELEITTRGLKHGSSHGADGPDVAFSGVLLRAVGNRRAPLDEALVENGVHELADVDGGIVAEDGGRKLMELLVVIDQEIVQSTGKIAFALKEANIGHPRAMDEEEDEVVFSTHGGSTSFAETIEHNGDFVVARSWWLIPRGLEW